MLLTIPGFSGIAPKVDKHMLGERQAQTALSVNIRSGTLSPMLGGSSASTIVDRSGVKNTLFKSPSGHWFSWLDEVDVVRSPLAGDTTGRVYFTGDGLPKFTDTALATSSTPYPFAAYNMAVPAPVSAAVATLGGTGSGNVETRAYVYTHVRNYNGFVEESAPSPVVLIDWQDGNSVTLSSFATAPSGSYNVTHRRIYRTFTGTQGTNYYYVGEQAIASTEFLDEVAGSSLAEVIPSLLWTAPPDALEGLTELPNGIMAGFIGKDVYFCEPYRPHAWPVTYMQTVAHDIVGLAALGQSLLVLTTGYPYLITGTHPSSMGMERLDIEQSCVAKRSISNVGGGVIYASPDGLVMISTAGTNVITAAYMDKSHWQALCSPSTLHGYEHDGRYYGFHSTGGFIFDPVEQNGALTTHSIVASCGFVDLVDDSLYYVITDTIYKLHAGNKLSYTWKSKKFQLPLPANFGVAQVIANSYESLTFKFYADGVLKLTKTVLNNKPFRLPAGYKGRFVEVELTGTDTVIPPLYLATTPKELANA